VAQLRNNPAGWLAPALLAALVALATPARAETTLIVEEGTTGQTVEVIKDTAIALESTVPFSELFIANPQIADISSISGTTLYVLGKQPGRTTLMLIRADNSIMSSIDIRVSPDISELTRRLKDVLPDEEIGVLSANDGLVLSGTVSSPEVVARALEVAGHYAQGRISNLLNIVAEDPPADPEPAPEPVAAPPVDIAAVEAQLRMVLPDEALAVHEIGGTVVLSGTVTSPDRAAQAVQIARLAAVGAEIVNLMTVTERQSCTIRTRRGGELVETAIPCGKN
jgi:Flp pilus assembly secretin CpaC